MSCDDLTGPFDATGPGSSVAVTIAFGPADQLYDGRACTLIRLHASGPSVVDAIGALLDAGVSPLAPMRVRGCRPERGCVHLFLLVDGHLGQVDLCAAMLPAAMPGTLPIPYRLPGDSG